MIITGCSHTGRSLGAYLLKDKNERVEEWGVRNDIPRDIKETLNDWRSDRLGTNCSKPLYHAQLSPDRVLSRDEWNTAIELFEKSMGFEKQPRVMVLHENKGRQHLHLVYSRIDENGHAISDSWTYVHHEKASREIERELGLDKTQGVFIDRTNKRPERTPSRNAIQQAERLKIDLKKIQTTVRQLYQCADNGQAFVAGLKSEGFQLARGDLSVYVIVDQLGGIHSLVSMIGVKADQLRNTLRDFDLQSLPSVQEVQSAQQMLKQTASLEKSEEKIELNSGIKLEKQATTSLTLAERFQKTLQERAELKANRGREEVNALDYSMGRSLSLSRQR